MEKDENIPTHDKRRLQVYADDEDVLVGIVDHYLGGVQGKRGRSGWRGGKRRGGGVGGYCRSTVGGDPLAERGWPSRGAGSPP